MKQLSKYILYSCVILLPVLIKAQHFDALRTVSPDILNCDELFIPSSEHNSICCFVSILNSQVYNKLIPDSFSKLISNLFSNLKSQSYFITASLRYAAAVNYQTNFASNKLEKQLISTTHI